MEYPTTFADSLNGMAKELEAGRQLLQAAIVNRLNRERRLNALKLKIEERKTWSKVTTGKTRKTTR